MWMTPFSWLCSPVRITVRDGAHSELVTKLRSKIAPSAASLSMCGVLTIGARWLWYAEMVARAKSSACRNRMLGRGSVELHVCEVRTHRATLSPCFEFFGGSTAAGRDGARGAGPPPRDATRVDC